MLLVPVPQSVVRVVGTDQSVLGQPAEDRAALDVRLAELWPGVEVSHPHGRHLRDQVAERGGDLVDLRAIVGRVCPQPEHQTRHGTGREGCNGRLRRVTPREPLEPDAAGWRG